MYKAIKIKKEYMFVLNAAFMYFEVKYIVIIFKHTIKAISHQLDSEEATS